MSEFENINKANELLEKLSGEIKKLLMPVGDSDFRDILKNQYVYVDKTLLLKKYWIPV